MVLCQGVTNLSKRSFAQIGSWNRIGAISVLTEHGPDFLSPSQVPEVGAIYFPQCNNEPLANCGNRCAVMKIFSELLRSDAAGLQIAISETLFRSVLLQV